MINTGQAISPLLTKSCPGKYTTDGFCVGQTIRMRSLKANGTASSGMHHGISVRCCGMSFKAPVGQTQGPVDDDHICNKKEL